MASLAWPVPALKGHLSIRSQFCHSGIRKAPGLFYRPATRDHRLRTAPILCTKLFPWEASSTYSSTDGDNSIIQQNNIVEPIDAEDSPELSSIQNKEQIYEMKSENTMRPQPFKWPMWLLGPSILLVTGMVPTLWLPLQTVFLGPNIAGLLSLIGLDFTFNMGAMLFLLMADSCARPKGGRTSPSDDMNRVPLTYRLWNLGASIIGFAVPFLMLLASHKGYLQQRLPFISFAMLLGPYLLLLSTQLLIEALTWHWKSPVWLLTPIVYEGYRVLQLMRGLQLGAEIAAPGWAVESIRGLVLWWVLVLGIQLMRVAWFAGREFQMNRRQSRVL